MNIEHKQTQPISINMIFLVIFLMIVLGMINN